MNLAAALNNRGMVHGMLGTDEAALRDFKSAGEAGGKPRVTAAAHNNAGLLLVKRGGRDEEAEELFRLATVADPAFADAFNNRGILLCERLGREEDGLRCFEEAVRIQPDHYPGQSNRGSALARLSRLEEAMEAYKAASECSPVVDKSLADTMGTIQALIDTRKAVGKPPSAGKPSAPAPVNVEHVLSGPSQPTAVATPTRGDKGKEASAPRNAEEKVPPVSGGKAPVDAEIGGSATGGGGSAGGGDRAPRPAAATPKASGAAAVEAGGASVTPGSPAVMSKMSRARMEAEAILSAVQSSMKPEDFTEEARRRRAADAHATALAMFKRGESQEALDHINLAILELKDESLYHDRGVFHTSQGEYAKALGDFSRALAINPERVETLIARGYAKRCTDDLSGALEDYDDAVRCGAGKDKVMYSETLCKRGIVYIMMDDFTNAIADFEDATAADADNVTAHFNLGSAYLDTGRFAESLASLQKASALGSKSRGLKCAMGQALVGLEDYEGAIREFRAALRMDEDGTGLTNDQIHLRLAEIMELNNK